MRQKSDTFGNFDKAFGEIEKRFGKGTLMRFNEVANQKLDVISTGCASLDEALGVGGVPRGRFIEIFGPEAVGKSTLCLHIVAEAQKLGLLVAYVDMEHALDGKYAANLHVDLDKLLISQPSSGDEALELVDTLAKTGQVGLIIVDSVAALVTQAELNGEIGDANVGGQARLMSQACRKLTSVLHSTNTCLIFVNQLRDKIGGVSWGANEITSGGKALKFYASIRMDIRKIGQIKDGEDIVGTKTRIKVIKNKVAPPFKQVEVTIVFGEGISDTLDLLETAITRGIIIQKGAWLFYKGENLCQGRAKASVLLKTNPDFKQELQQQLNEKM